MQQQETIECNKWLLNHLLSVSVSSSSWRSLVFILCSCLVSLSPVKFEPKWWWFSGRIPSTFSLTVQLPSFQIKKYCPSKKMRKRVCLRHLLRRRNLSRIYFESLVKRETKINHRPSPPKETPGFPRLSLLLCNSHGCCCCHSFLEWAIKKKI